MSVFQSNFFHLILVLLEYFKFDIAIMSEKTCITECKQFSDSGIGHVVESLSIHVCNHNDEVHANTNQKPVGQEQETENNTSAR